MPPTTSYTELKLLIEAKAINSFADFFLFIEQKQFREDTGISRRRLQALIASPGHMTMDELWTISRAIGVDFAEMGALVKSDFIKAAQ